MFVSEFLCSFAIMFERCHSSRICPACFTRRPFYECDSQLWNSGICHLLKQLHLSPSVILCLSPLRNSTQDFACAAVSCDYPAVYAYVHRDECYHFRHDPQSIQPSIYAKNIDDAAANCAKTHGWATWRFATPRRILLFLLSRRNQTYKQSFSDYELLFLFM